MSQISADRIDLCDIVAAEAAKLDMKCSVVGGVVRDLLRGEPLDDRDIDCIVEGSAARLAEQVATQVAGDLTTYDTFLTAKVSGIKNATGYDEIDLVTARSETYSAPGALPSVTAGTLDDDLARRDFTINAMSLPLVTFTDFARGNISREELLVALNDPHGGQQDLENRIIRVLNEKSFYDDPTRIIRLVRYLVRIDGEIEPQTKASLSAAVATNVFASLSTERLWSETRKALAEEQFAQVVDGLGEWGVFHQHPEFSLAFKGLSNAALSVYAEEAAPFNSAGREEILLALAVVTGGDLVEQVVPKLGRGKRWVRRVRGLFTDTDKPSSRKVLAEAEQAAVAAVLQVMSG